MKIKISSNIQDLNGQGEEYLTDKDGNILAKFFNGSQVTQFISIGNDEITKVAS